MTRFSRTRSSWSRVSSCGTTPRRARIAGPCRATSSPNSSNLPAVGGETQPTMRIVELLPAPLGPRNPKASPRWMSTSIPSTATKSPKRLVRSRARTSTSSGVTIIDRTQDHRRHSNELRLMPGGLGLREVDSAAETKGNDPQRTEDDSQEGHRRDDHPRCDDRDLQDGAEAVAER